MTTDELEAASSSSTRLLKKAEACFAVLPPETPEFDHFLPADWLFRNPSILDSDVPEVNETLERAERTIAALNNLIK